MIRPLISVAIPTRNRPLCAENLIREVLGSIPDCQVVVNDNSDDETLRALLSDIIGDPRLDFRHTTEMMSVVDNFNSVLGRTTGEYVTFIGDDDMIGPGFLDTILWMKEKSLDAIRVRTKARALHYFWPGVVSNKWGDMGGDLYFSDFSGKVRFPKADRAIREALQQLGRGPCEMPRIYLGVVSRRLIERVDLSFGALFGGFSPDVYSSLLLTVCCEAYAEIDYPIIIPGASPKSTSAARAANTDKGKLKENDHIGRFTEVNWDARIPQYYSPYTVWAQSHLMAAIKSDTKVRLNAFAHLYATCLLFSTKESIPYVWKSLWAHGSFVKAVSIVVITLLSGVYITAQYVTAKIPVLLSRTPAAAKTKIQGLETSRLAKEALCRALDSKPLELKEIPNS